VEPAVSMPNQPSELVARIVSASLADALRSYRGNLQSVEHVVSNGWLPDAKDPVVGQHINTLSQFLNSIGKHEDDEFLLRYALTVPGAQRGIVPPLLVLEPNRMGFSVKRQRESAGQVQRLREALQIGRQLDPDLSSDTEQAMKRLADLSSKTDFPKDFELLDCFQRLSRQDSGQLAERALTFLRGSRDTLEEIGSQLLQQLACFRDSPLDEPTCLELIDLRIFWPASMYRDSGDAVATKLLGLIEQANQISSLNPLLLCLAWTRSLIAKRAFQEWLSSPPTWSPILPAEPAKYAKAASWYPNLNGGPDALISAYCYRLELSGSGNGQNVKCRGRLKKKCDGCGGPIYCLFDFSSVSDSYFEQDIADAPRRILGCLHCACFGPSFIQNRGGETKQIVGADEIPGWESDTYKSVSRILHERPLPPFACAEPFAFQDCSTLGGCPSWLQDAEYPHCIECGSLMKFLAQHDNGAVGEEGLYFAFYCATCSMTAVTYQQT
jgi:hypothetical protein